MNRILLFLQGKYLAAQKSHNLALGSLQRELDTIVSAVAVACFRHTSSLTCLVYLRLLNVTGSRSPFEIWRWESMTLSATSGEYLI